MRHTSKPIAPTRTDFGAILGRCLNDMGDTRNYYASLLQIHPVQLSNLVNWTAQSSFSRNWIHSKQILEKLKKEDSHTFAIYESDFEKALDAMKTPPPAISKPGRKPKSELGFSLSSTWSKATSHYIDTVIGFYDDDIDDVIKAIDVNDLKHEGITATFLRNAQFWRDLKHEDIPPVLAQHVVAAVKMLNEIYFIDKDHPLYPERQKVEIALGIK